MTVEVAVDRGTLDDAAVNAAYKSLLVRLVSDGFAFVDLAGGADLIVRLRDAGPKSVFVVVDSQVGSLRAAVALDPTASEPEQLGLVQTALALARTARDDLMRAKREPPPVDETALWRLGAIADGLVLSSGGGAGAMLDAYGTFGKTPLTFVLGVAGHRPLGLPGELRLIEWAGVFGLRLGGTLLAPWFSTDAGLDAGLCQQRAAYADATGVTGQTALFDLCAMARWRVAVAFVAGWRIGATAGTWLTLHERRYLTTSRPLWTAGKARPFFGLGAQYTL